ncbi:MAG TPA: hypothetical protein PKD97_10980, partial [Ferruginibacter sp.]|nr:hypothetical protein [Ferruginibacter sp.]
YTCGRREKNTQRSCSKGNGYFTKSFWRAVTGDIPKPGEAKDLLHGYSKRNYLFNIILIIGKLVLSNY